MLKQHKLAIAVAAAMGAGTFATSALSADGDSVAFWPQIIASDTVTTVVSVINRVAGSNAGGAANLHYSLFYKSPVNSASCAESNFDLPTSNNDIQTFDVLGIYGADTKGVLFNDPSVNNKWNGITNDWMLADGKAPMRGFLLVDNSGGSGDIRGEAFVFDYARGAAWGYPAYTNNEDYDFREIGANNLEVDDSAYNIMPLAEFSTAFMATPVGANQFSGTLKSRLTIASSRSSREPVMFDRDENPISGTVPQDVTCVGRVDIESLLSAPVNKMLNNGGWVSLKTIADSGTAITGLSDAYLIKLEYADGDTFNGEPAEGTFNNAIELFSTTVNALN